MSTTEAPRVLAPVGMVQEPWDTDESFINAATKERERAEGRVAALLALADFIVDRNLPAPLVDIGFSIDCKSGDHDRVIAKWYANKNEAPAIVKALGGTLDAPATKSIDEHSGYLNVTRRLPDVPLTLRVIVTGQVCEMVDTGRTEEVEVEEVVTPAEVRKVTKVQPVLERRCPDSLLALADVDATDSDVA